MPKSVLDLYGPEVHKPGSFARNGLLACGMIELLVERRDLRRNALKGVNDRVQHAAELARNLLAYPSMEAGGATRSEFRSKGLQQPAHMVDQRRASGKEHVA